MLKRQVRVLGLAATSRHSTGKIIVCGAVFRGSLWLEGVVALQFRSKRGVGLRLASTLRGSRYYKQLRAAMLDDSLASIVNLGLFSRQISLPVLGFGRSLRSGSVRFAGCDERGAEEILRVAVRNGIPEAVRVAGLLVRALNV